jgi:hypothetical protein
MVENVRTSHADMLSLASMTQGDIRRALLQLQCWTLTGAAGQRRHAAPVYVHAEDGKSAETKATTVEKTQTKPAAVPQAERNSNCHTPVVVVPDSDDEFTQVRNKKRRLQRFPSTDDDSQSSGLGLKGDDPFVGVDECSQESYSQAPCEFEASVSVPRTVALSADLAPAVHRMCVESAGTGAASRMLTVSKADV